MQQYATTVLDVTHSLANQTAGVTGGRPDMIETIAKAGIAVGVDGIFIETHFDPANAKVMVQICCIWIILRPND
jgi:2-dehydro-3-deoxyphosphooctonate aldolase (KDO 8-P synthase)